MVRNGAEVALIFNGRLVESMPWQISIDVGRALLAKGRLAEEHEKAESIANDTALLMRKGVPIQLSSRPDILKEAHHRAQHDTCLRRAIPKAPGIEPSEIVGTPSIKQKEPKK